jgi:hypothetical protein
MGEGGAKRDRKIIDYVDSALNFVEAARRLLAPNRFDVHMFLPCGFMVSHAAELALIAYVRIEGVKGGQDGHDLVKLLAAAKAAGLATTPGFEPFVAAQNEAHKRYRFRYPDYDDFRFVDPNGAVSMVGGQATAVKAHILLRFAERWHPEKPY